MRAADQPGRNERVLDLPSYIGAKQTMRVLTGFQRALRLTKQIDSMRDLHVLEELNEYFQDLVSDEFDKVSACVPV